MVLMNNWFRRNKSAKVEGTPLPEAPILPSVPSEIAEDSVSVKLSARRMNSWLDDAVSDCEKNGGLEHLAGKGKPIHVSDGDALNSILKNSNFLPSWLELQHEIRDDIRALLRKHDTERLPPTVKTELDAINKKIVRYNASVPTPLLQKGRLHPESIREQAIKWE
jgi:hypothetical protein